MRQDTKTDLFKLIDTLDSIDDLDLVREMVKTRSKKLARDTKSGLIIGDKVIISGSAKIESGKVIKINRTRAVVDCYDKTIDGMVAYNVPFSMIRKAIS
jgi:hypothetical protein